MKSLCAAALAAWVFVLAMPSGVRAENLAGHWHLVFDATCHNQPANLAACRAVQQPADFPVMRIAGSTLTVHGVGDYVSDARGRYVVRFVTTITEHLPHGLPPWRCDNATVFGSAFNGTCRETGTGHGHIAAGGTGMDDFWQDDAQGTWNGRPPARFAESSPSDTFNPACAGTLHTRQLLRLLGVHHVPRGISARLALTHRP